MASVKELKKRLKKALKAECRLYKASQKAEQAYEKIRYRIDVLEHKLVTKELKGE
jgi:hypothetical protein